MAQVTPIRAATMLPPMIDQGWASGLAGAANRSTADAPIGATIKGTLAVLPSASELTKPVRQMPVKAPVETRSLSRKLVRTSPGRRR
jgi:hypothetical protein